VNLGLFAGRDAVLADACVWLRSPDGPATLVVTGEPGSGKSALLARLFAIAPGGITALVDARGKTGHELMAALCAACQVAETTSPGRLLAALRDRARPMVLAIDAADEAVEPSALPVVDHVLAPLAAGVAGSGVRLLLATRRHLVDTLRGPLRVIDLDAEPYADANGLRSLARACLLEPGAASPYHRAPAPYVDEVAAAVAEAAGRSFLVALITARGLAGRDDLFDPHDATGRAGLPAMAADAVRTDLDHRLGGDAARARDLLLPLAYGRGDGLPRDDLWPVLAGVLAGRPYTVADVGWVVERAGSYVVEAGGAYRLCHELVAEHLRRGRDEAQDQIRIVDALIELTPVGGDGRPDWSRAHRYVLAALAGHAAGTERLEALLTDPGFLLSSRRSAVLAHHPSTPDARAAVDAYRRADARLRACPEGQRPAYLQLAARCAHATNLADAIAAADRPLTWTTAWALWRRQPAHETLSGHSGPVRAVALGRLDGREVVVSGGDDHTVRVWDAAAGTPIGDLLTTRWVRAVAMAQVDGRAVVAAGGFDETVRVWDTATGTPVQHPDGDLTEPLFALRAARLHRRTAFVSGSRDGTVRVWDAATGKVIGQPFVGHTSSVNAVAVGRLDGRPVVVSASDDRTVRVWDATTGAALGAPLTGHTEHVYAVALGRLDGRTVIVSGGEDLDLRVWDAATGTPVGEPLAGHTHWVNAVAVGQLGGRTVVVSGGDDGTLRMWDPATGLEIGETNHTHPVDALTIGTVDGRPVVVSGGADYRIRIWDATTLDPDGPRSTGHTRPVCAVALGHIDGRAVVVSGSGDYTIGLWDAATGVPVRDPLIGHGGWVYGVAFGQIDGHPVVVSGSTDGTVRVWDAVTGNPIGLPRYGHTNWVHAVTLAEVEGRTVVVSCSTDQTIRVSDAATGELVGDALTGHAGAVTSVATGHLDGRLVVVSGGEDHTVRVWDAATGAPFADPFPGHTAAVTSVTAGQLDGRLVVVSGSEDHTVRVWDAATGAAIGPGFTGHTSGVRAVAMGQLDGRTVVVSGGDDHTVRTWDVATGAPLGAPIDVAAKVLAVGIAPDAHVIVGTDLGIVSLHRPITSPAAEPR